MFYCLQITEHTDLNFNLRVTLSGVSNETAKVMILRVLNWVLLLAQTKKYELFIILMDNVEPVS